MDTAELSFPLDQDGFISQECPECTRRFKVVMEAGEGKPLSFCPYCGHEGQNCWWTTEQAEYIKAVVANSLLNPLFRDFQQDLKGLNNPRGGVTVSTSPIQDRPAHQPEESNAPMQKHTFACCDETIKHQEWSGDLHCIVCGAVG